MIYGNSLRASALALLLFIFTITSNTLLLPTTHDQAQARQMTILSPQLLQGVSLGYQYFWANIMWMQTMAYFGSKLDQADFAYLSRVLNSVTTLNPKAEHVYYMAATVLRWSTGNTLLSKPLLERAIHTFPQDWHWPYYRGFNAYWFDHDYETAGKLLSKAATLPNVHPTIINIALRMQSKTGHIDTALSFLRQLIAEKQDKNIRKKLLRQYNALLTEKIIREIEIWLDQHDIKIHNNDSLARVIRLGAPIPKQLPDGGMVTLNSDGEIVSNVSSKRFKIFVPPKRQRSME